MPLTFKEYQDAAGRTAKPEITFPNVLLGLCGETGELADAFKKHIYHGHELSTEKVIDEIGDVLWYVAVLCSLLCVDLDAVAHRNIWKLQLRYPEGFSSEASQLRLDTKGE